MIAYTKRGMTLLALASLMLFGSPALANEPGYKVLTHDQLSEMIETAAKLGTVENLEGVDLRGADLEGLDTDWLSVRGARLDAHNAIDLMLNSSKSDFSFAGANFAGADFSASHPEFETYAKAFNDLESRFGSVDLDDTNFQDAILSGLTVRDRILRGVDFSGADLRRANFETRDFTNIIFIGAKLAGMDLSDRQFIDTNFEGSNLTGVDFSGTFFRKARNRNGLSFARTNLTRTNFAFAEIEGRTWRVDFTGAIIHGTNFENFFITGTMDWMFTNASFSDVKLSKLLDAFYFDVAYGRARRLFLDGSTISNCDLSGLPYLNDKVSFKLARMEGNKLDGTRFRQQAVDHILQASQKYGIEADFSNTNLRGVDLSGRVLRNVNFSNTDLSYANLRGAVLSQGQLDSAVLEKAIMQIKMDDGPAKNCEAMEIKHSQWQYSRVVRDPVRMPINVTFKLPEAKEGSYRVFGTGAFARSCARISWSNLEFLCSNGKWQQFGKVQKKRSRIGCTFGYAEGQSVRHLHSGLYSHSKDFEAVYHGKAP